MSTALEPLAAGQRMTRVEFHERYEAMPPGRNYELIGVRVHMASPVSPGHCIACGLAGTWLGYYAIRTPGVRVGHDGSLLLSDEAEVQPDLMLFIDPQRGGQTRSESGYLAGCPELVIEVAWSSRATGLGPKLAEYDQAGALEYVVFTLGPDEIHWNARHDGKLVRIPPDADGLYPSAAFPGLWLDPVAWHTNDGPTLMPALDRGLATPAHAAFVARLAAAEA